MLHCCDNIAMCVQFLHQCSCLEASFRRIFRCDSTVKLGRDLNGSYTVEGEGTGSSCYNAWDAFSLKLINVFTCTLFITSHERRHRFRVVWNYRMQATSRILATNTLRKYRHIIIPLRKTGHKNVTIVCTVYLQTRRFL